MPRIIITKECKDAIHKAALWPFNDNDSRVVLGGWSIPLEQDTIDRLKQFRHFDETWSDCILRLLASQKGMN